MKKSTTAAILTAISLLFGTPLKAERSRAVAPLNDTLSIEFVDGGSDSRAVIQDGSDASLDLQVVSHQGEKQQFTRVQKRVGVRINRRGGIAIGSALLTARLEDSDGRTVIRIDGRKLSAAPLTVELHQPIGSVSFHTIEIEVPVSAPEGELNASLSWEVTSE
jgi:hypothetical protein